MNVMKQDAMDDKIKERCMWKTMHVRGSRQIEKLSRNYWADANLDGSNSYWASIKKTESSSRNRESIEKLSRLR